MLFFIYVLSCIEYEHLFNMLFSINLEQKMFLNLFLQVFIWSTNFNLGLHTKLFVLLVFDLVFDLILFYVTRPMVPFKLQTAHFEVNHLEILEQHKITNQIFVSKKTSD